MIEELWEKAHVHSIMFYSLAAATPCANKSSLLVSALALMADVVQH